MGEGFIFVDCCGQKFTIVNFSILPLVKVPERFVQIFLQYAQLEEGASDLSQRENSRVLLVERPEGISERLEVDVLVHVIHYKCQCL